jgi:hypothetical protein
MKSRRVVFIALLLFWSIAVGGAVAATYTLETVSGAPDGARAELQAILQPQGYRVLNEKGAVWCEVWIRKEIANLAKPASLEAKYPALHLGQLLGVMRFHAAGSDYRGQAIKPGLYTLRYAPILQDGNHLGVSPILDFVLLIPAADDTKEADAVLSSDEVVALSRKASGTNHPAVISLTAPPEGAGCATLEKDDANHWILKIKSQSKPAADLPIGIIVVGKAEG